MEKAKRKKLTTEEKILKRKAYRELNRDKIRAYDRERLKIIKEKESLRDRDYKTRLSKIDVIKLAVEFVDRIEKRKGLISFEELFGELLDIAFYIPSGACDDLPVSQQLYDIWCDVKHFANPFEKELGEVDWDRYKELVKLGLCKYCEKGVIVNRYNTCSKCRGIMVYINKLG